MADLVSVIVLAKGKEKFVKHCLDSLNSMTYKKIEISVLDKFTIPKAYNYGFSTAKGKYVFIVNGDSIVSENFLKYAVRLFEEDESIGAITGLRKQIPLDNLVSKLYHARFKRHDKLGNIKCLNGNYVIRKELFDKLICPMNTKVIAGEEGVVARKLVNNGFKIKRLWDYSMIHMDSGSILNYFKIHLWYAKGKVNQKRLNVDYLISGFIYLCLLTGRFEFLLLLGGISLKFLLSAIEHFSIIDSIKISIVETLATVLRALYMPIGVIR